MTEYDPTAIAEAADMLGAIVGRSVAEQVLYDVLAYDAFRVLDGIINQSADHREAARLLQTQLAREYLELRRFHAR